MKILRHFLHFSGRIILLAAVSGSRRWPHTIDGHFERWSIRLQHRSQQNCTKRHPHTPPSRSRCGILGFQSRSRDGAGAFHGLRSESSNAERGGQMRRSTTARIACKKWWSIGTHTYVGPAYHTVHRRLSRSACSAFDCALSVAYRWHWHTSPIGVESHANGGTARAQSRHQHRQTERTHLSNFVRMRLLWYSSSGRTGAKGCRTRITPRLQR